MKKKIMFRSYLRLRGKDMTSQVNYKMPLVQGKDVR